MKTWHEYYKDKNKTEVLIKYTIKLPSMVEDFNIDDHPIHIRQKRGEIYVNYIKIITQTLFDDIKEFSSGFLKGETISEELTGKNPSQYIIGYIGETLPKINKEILDRKYKEGHILLRTISQFDIYDVFIVDKKGNYHAILWPLPIPGFSEVKKFQKEIVVIFIRDLIDAMTEYLYFNLDECIRKIITSLENYFIYYQLQPSTDRENKKFIRQVNEFITEKYYPLKERDLKILRKNILFVYEIRTSIVHNKLRLKLDNLMFCKKAIGTLLYIYQSKFTFADAKKNYISTFDSQFKLITDMIIGLNLDYFEKAETVEQKSKIINNSDELNESMFASLAITETQMRMAKENLK